MNVAGLIRFGGHLPKGGYDVPHGAARDLDLTETALRDWVRLRVRATTATFEEGPMSGSNDDEKNRTQIGRRKFLRIGGLGAAALAAGAAGRAPETEAPETDGAGATRAGATRPGATGAGATCAAARVVAVPSEFRSGAGVRAVHELRRVHGHACRSAGAFPQLGLRAASRPAGRRHHGQHAALRVRRPSGRRRVQHHGVRQRRRAARQPEVQLQKQLQGLPDQSLEPAASTTSAATSTSRTTATIRACRGTKTIRSC